MMKRWIRFIFISSCVLVLTSLLPAWSMHQKHHHSNENRNSNRDDRNDDRNANHNSCRMTILVKDNKQGSPIAGAMVRVQSAQSGTSFETAVMTNNKGIAKVSNVPYGRTLIQVVAVGWRTF